MFPHNSFCIICRLSRLDFGFVDLDLREQVGDFLCVHCGGLCCLLLWKEVVEASLLLGRVDHDCLCDSAHFLLKLLELQN